MNDLQNINKNSPFYCYAQTRIPTVSSMYFLWEIQIGNIINSNNAETNLFTFLKSSKKFNKYLKNILYTFI
jgi:hypothetical protein